MSAMENMVRTVLRALDVDVDTLKAEVTGRIVQFETNVQTLNTTLISLHERTARIEKTLDALCTHLKIPTAKQTETNNVDHGSRSGNAADTSLQ